MLDLSFDAVRREIESAERFRDVHVSSMREMVQRYHDTFGIPHKAWSRAPRRPVVFPALRQAS